MKIEKFEDIQAWQKARELVRSIYQATNEGDFARPVKYPQSGYLFHGAGLKDQIRRASVSIMSNVAEGYARQTGREFIQFLYIALGLAAEVQSQLYIARDLRYLSQEEFDKIYGLAGETAKLITGFIKYLKGPKP